MKLSVKNLGITAGAIWGGAVLLVGLAHLVWPNYGTAFLELAASIYPGYEIGGFGSVIIGTLYALLDGGIGARSSPGSTTGWRLGSPPPPESEPP